MTTSRTSRFARSALPLLAVLFLAGPARGQVPRAAVDGHELAVLSWPPATIELDTTLTYVGHRTFELYDVAAAEAHVFVAASPDSVVQRLYWFQIERVLPDSDHRYDYAELPRRFVRGGLEFVADARYGPGYSLDQVDGEGDTAQVLRLLAEAGYRMPAEMMRFRMVTLDEERRRELLVIYVEDLELQDLSIRVLETAGEAAWRRIADRLQERALAGIEIERRGVVLAGAAKPAEAGERRDAVEPAPDAVEPAPEAVEPAPEAVEPEPAPAEPAPEPAPEPRPAEPAPAEPRAATIERPQVGAFAFVHEVMLAAPRGEVWNAITGDLSGWWDHNFSGDPAQFFLEPWPGGRFLEVFEEGSRDGVLHGTVTFAKRPEMLRFEGPLGLTGYAVHGVYTYQLEPVGESTRLTLSVRMTGELGEGWPEAVEGAWRHFLYDGLKPFLEAGRP